MNLRLQQFLAAENVSQAQFAEFLGVARASVSHIIAGRNKPSYEFICSMMVHYPNLNMEWLLTGKGKMYKNLSDSPAASEIFYSPEKSEIPVTPLSDDDDLIFEEAPAPAAESFTTPVQAARKADISRMTPDQARETISSTLINAKTQISQSVVNQRKVVKVTILFDDGTYQEL